MSDILDVDLLAFERGDSAARRAVVDVPQLRCAGVAQRGGRPVRRDGSGPPSSLRELRMAEGIHTPMQDDELARADAIVDQRQRDVLLDEGGAGDDAVIARRHRRDDGVMGALTWHIPV